MLIRIAPDIFYDEKYECVTIQAVRKEIFGTRKFKDKYPWRKDFKAKIKTVSTSKLDSTAASVVHSTAEEYFNHRTGRPYSLSPPDKEIAAFALSNSWDVSTGDKDLIDFLNQQFNIRSYSSLEVLNIWLSKKAIVWNEELHTILNEWSALREKPQPEKAKSTFYKLTGKKYPGP